MRLRWIYNINDEIDPQYSDLPVLLMSLISGMVDALAYSCSSVFVAMQSGNTIFLALACAKYVPDRETWVKSLTSLISFVIGAFLFSLLRYLGYLRKSVLCVSFFLQALFLFVSAALGQWEIVPALSSKNPSETIINPDTDKMILLPLALMSFQFGGQLVATRALKISGLPIHLLTALYCDFASDSRIFNWKNVERNRRVIAIVVYFLGAFACGWLGRSKVGMPMVLWISGILKLGTSVSWLFWKPKVLKEKAELSNEP